MLAALPFVSSPAIAKDWLLVSPAKKWPPVDFTNEQGETYKAGIYSKFFMRFETQSQAASFKSKILPTTSKELVGTHKNIPTTFACIRSGYRGAIKSMYRLPDNISHAAYDWNPLYVKLVCVENGAAYSIDKFKFDTWEEAWSFIDSLIIKEDDGESYSWERLVQPFILNHDQQPEFYRKNYNV